MYLAINMEEYNINNIFFSDSTKNTVIENSLFARLFYSTPNINLNGCFFAINITDYIKNNKISNLLNHINIIENDILNLYNTKSIKILKLKETINNQINNKYSKFSDNKQVIMKISGIWDNNNEYGLTFKIINL